MKKFLFLLTLILSLTLFISCSTPDPDPDPDPDTGKDPAPDTEENGDDSDTPDAEPVIFDVSVVFADDHVSTPHNRISATEGADLEIPLTFSEGYTYSESTPAGEYDYERGVLVIRNISSSTRRVVIESKEKKEYMFKSFLSAADSCDTVDDFYYEGTVVTVTAGDKDATFLGWSFEKSLSAGGSIVSTDKTFTFALTDSIATSNNIRIYSNYTYSNVYYYDVNGGVINQNSVNIKDNTYYTATVSGERVEVTLGAKYFETVETASTFYDDATFTRPGYVLIEYNTKPDGTGEGFNMGAKFQIDSVEGVAVLYCIWAKETDQQAFTFSDIKISRPSGASETSVPYWKENGVQITEYVGNDKTVVIPNKIGDKYVISVAAGAFKNKSVETVVFGRYVLKLEDGAFVGCTELETMYYSDGITYASDSFLDENSKKSFTSLRINATMPPKLSPQSWAGLFAIKLTRVMSTANTKRIIMIGGSSTYDGISSSYVEALLNGDGEQEYSFINFGTTRIFTVMMYLDAMEHYTKEGDYVVLAAENHARCFGDTSFVANSFDDSEGMYPSLMRLLDISKYTDMFSSLSEFNRTRAAKAPTRYEEICKVGVGYESDKYGDDISNYERRSLLRNQSGCVGYGDIATITFNEKIKSTKARWQDETRETADWKNPENETWCDLNDPRYVESLNRMLREVKSSGAKAYFAFVPVDGTGKPGSDWGVIPEAKADPANWIPKYDALIESTFVELDGIIGRSIDYIYHHNYFYDSAYHLNNWGRPIRTYQFYVDFCKEMGIAEIAGYLDRGTDFYGCLFESGVEDGSPVYKVDYIEAIK